MNKSRLLLITATALLTSFAHAQFSLVGRASQVNYDFFYGFAGDSFSGNDVRNESTLDASDSTSLVGSSNGSGFYPPSNTSWSSTVTWDIGHQYAVTGTVASATKITSSGTSVLSSIPIVATSNVGSNNPGNILTLDILLANSQEIRFSGELSSPSPLNRNGSVIYVYKYDGFNYNLFTLQAQNSTFDRILNLTPGRYRFESSAYATATGAESVTSRWNYSIEAVPEPTSMAAMAAGVAMLARKGALKK